MTLHERIATVLGWTVKDTQSLSLHSLRELVRPLDRGLAAEISGVITSARVLREPPCKGCGRFHDPEDDPRLAPVANLLRDYFKRAP